MNSNWSLEISFLSLSRNGRVFVGSKPCHAATFDIICKLFSLFLASDNSAFAAREGGFGVSDESQ
jgi:hypothetical protein